MMNHDSVPWARRMLLVAMAGLLSVAWLAARPAEAADTAKSLEKIDTSLQWIPEDAAVYSSTLRNREQVEAIAKSRAWAKLQALPVVQMGLQMYKMQADSPDNPAGKVQAALKDPQVQDLLALLGDMFSEEAFVYADADMVDAIRLMQDVQVAMNYGPAMIELSGRKGDLSQEDMQAMLVVGALAENLDAIKVPGLIFGFKLTDTSRAVLNLGKLELIAGFGLKQDPRFADCLKRTKVDEHEYLVLTLTGDMIPWDELPLDRLREVETEEGSVDKLVAKVKKESLVIAIGLRDDYLLLSIGSSTDVLAKLGEGKSLADRPEFAPLAPFADKRVVSIGYVSQAMNEVANSNERNLDDLLEFGDHMLPLVELDDDQEAQIRKDAAALAEDIKRMLPKPGAVMAFSFLTDQGVEGYTHDWTDDAASRWALTLARRACSRTSADRRSWRSSREARSRSSATTSALSGLPSATAISKSTACRKCRQSERKEFEQVAEEFADVLPLIQRAHETNREKLLPALDGQCGLVLDAKLESKQFIKDMPATDEAMPMVEPALLLGVKDSGLMREALVAYWEIFDDALDVAEKIEPEAAELPIPEPEVVETSDGELFVFTPPEECPVDKQITPNVGLGERVCVFSASRSHTERLLKDTPLAVGGVLAKTDRPLAMAACFDWAGLLTTARPWIDLATDEILRDKMGDDAVKTQSPGIKKQVHTVLDVLSAVRRITAKTYVKNGVTVTHTQTEIRDID